MNISPVLSYTYINYPPRQMKCSISCCLILNLLLCETGLMRGGRRRKRIGSEDSVVPRGQPVSCSAVNSRGNQEADFRRRQEIELPSELSCTLASCEKKLRDWRNRPRSQRGLCWSGPEWH